MKGLYLLLDVATILFPLLLSFDKKVAYVRHWKYVLTAGMVVGIPFLIWDMLFTAHGFWGFNPDYLVGIYLYNLPVEEVLFFLFVPFSCLFIYVCVKAYFARIGTWRINGLIYFLLLCYIGCIGFLTFSKNGAYSQAVIASSLLTLALVLLCKQRTRFLPLAFVISLLPFLLVNGILTGGFTEEPVVWYNPSERLPYGIFTIPVEDVLYSFTLIGLNVVVYELISGRAAK
jgi:lycopene cyclase domain-containing protein